MSKINNKKSGFTLVETFVAITVLMIAVLGPMSLLSKALKDSIYIRDTITATFLAQEGVEIIIDKRNNGYILASGTTEHESCNLTLDNDLGYNCSGRGDITKFTRSIKVTSTGKQLKITSTVSGANLPGGKIESTSIIFQ